MENIFHSSYKDWQWLAARHDNDVDFHVEIVTLNVGKSQKRVSFEIFNSKSAIRQLLV